MGTGGQRSPAWASWAYGTGDVDSCSAQPEDSQQQRLLRVLIGDWRVFEHSHPWAALEFVAGLLVVARRYQKALQGHETLLELFPNKG